MNYKKLTSRSSLYAPVRCGRGIYHRRATYYRTAGDTSPRSIIYCMDQFIGTWKLVSFEQFQPGGQVSYPYGRNPVGLLMYDSSGHMSVQVMRSDRTATASGESGSLSPEEIKEAVEGYTAFFGTYEVNEAEGSVTHRVEGHVLPNSVGKELKRSYEFKGEQLILRPSLDRRVVWERVR